MRRRTLLAVAAMAVVLAGVAAYGLAGTGSGGDLSERWVSDTGRDTTGNHHAPVVATVDGETLVVAPVNAPVGEGPCSLVALDADGSRRWTDGMPAEDCNIHGFGDPLVTDFDGDGADEVYVATTEDALVTLDARTGDESSHRPLSWWGYTAPVVADLDDAPGRELAVVDLSGATHVYGPDGERRWRANLSGVTAQPVAADVDADSDAELAVGEGDNLTLLGAGGRVEWRVPAGEGRSVDWLVSGQADDDAPLELVVATVDGRVVALDGREGRVEWDRDLGEVAAVHAFGDGDGDGQAEVYATALDGKVRALDASDGDVEWTTTLTTADVQMTPPPALGDLDGDGDPELVAVSQDGVVHVLDPASGSVLATYERSVTAWTYPTLADLDGDGADEALVVYGDGRVVALSYSS